MVVTPFGGTGKTDPRSARESSAPSSIKGGGDWSALSTESLSAGATESLTGNGSGSTSRASTSTRSLLLSEVPITAERDQLSMEFLGSIPLQPGEIVEGEPFERPLSAPPPPGFGENGSEQRSRMANDILWGSSTANGNGSSTRYMPQDELYHHNRSHQQQGSISGSRSFATAPSQATHTDTSSGEHPSSISNLEDAIGSGLLQSLDAAHGSDRNHSSNGQTNQESLSFNRMTRHAASRLIGQSSPTPLDVPTYFETNNGTNPRLVSTDPPSSALFQDRPRTGIAYAHSNSVPMAGTSPNNDAGFPSSLSSPPRHIEVDEKEQAVRRSTTPVQMFPGQGNRRDFPASRDIGMNVVEPEGVSQFHRAANTVVSKRMDQPHRPALVSDRTEGSDSNRSMKELERGVNNMFSPDAREFKPAPNAPPRGSVPLASASSSISEPGTELSARQAEEDIRPYLWSVDSNEPSRTLAIFRCAWIHVQDVRAACAKFGALESFRADFSTQGIYFVSYYDIRSAQYASLELLGALQRLSLMQGNSEDILVHFCLSLSSSSQFDDSFVVISNLPSEVTDPVLKSMLSAYGALRSAVMHTVGTYLIEFQNLQEAKQAVLELDSSQPWGPSVMVENCVRSAADRKRGRELLGIIGRWRQGLRQQPQQAMSNEHQRHVQGNARAQSSYQWSGGAAPQTHHQPPQNQTQYVVGPDGRYQQVVFQNPSRYEQSQFGGDSAQPQVIQGPNGLMYVATQVPHAGNRNGRSYQQHGHHQHAVVSNVPYSDPRPPFYAHAVSSDGNSVSGRSHRSVHSHTTHGTHGTHGTYGTHGTHGTENTEKDNMHLMLDLDSVELGGDTRTSLMVRNIPNKYTQQMLLAEFEENGHGPGVIDFFYLPIDFKNRCNRGYAFINFVDYKDILAFHRRYFGKHWRTFNSDKICDITYARIQGKDAMLKRFENSALMEKDDEYKPLVFCSHGAGKGTKLPFPNPAPRTQNRTEL